MFETRGLSSALIASAAAPEALGCRAARFFACYMQLIAFETPYCSSDGQRISLDTLSAERQVIGKKSLDAGVQQPTEPT